MSKQLRFKNVIILWLLGEKTAEEVQGAYSTTLVQISLSLPLTIFSDLLDMWLDERMSGCRFPISEVGPSSRTSQEFLLFRCVVHDVRNRIWKYIQC